MSKKLSRSTANVSRTGSARRPRSRTARSSRTLAERFAARFAAKEAAFKALGTGWSHGVRWVDVEITHAPSGKPELTLRGQAEEIARQMGVVRTAVSISHAGRFVVAQVIFESDG